MKVLANIVLVAMLCGGCTTGREAQRVMLDVPYDRATPGRCGDYAAREVIAYWHEDTSVESLDGINNTVQMLAALNQAGLVAEVEDGSTGLVCEEIAQGRPAIIVLSGYGGEYHCLTVIGCDDRRREVVCHTRRGPGVVMPGMLLDVLSPRAPWFVITARDSIVEEPS